MSRNRVLRSRFRESVLVTCKSGEAFAGVLYSSDDRTLVLRSAEAIGAGENGVNLPLDGEVIVFVDNVAYIQRA